MSNETTRPLSQDPALLAIVIFKFVKGVILIAVGFGAIHYLSHDLEDSIDHWVDAFRIDPDSRYVQALFAKADVISAKELKELSVGTFFYAVLVLTEGTGLALRRPWAEYFTIVITASFLPLELYEMHKRVTPMNVTVLALNLAVLGYLVWRVRGERARRRAGGES